MNLDQKVILITGGAGCIGSNLTRALLGRAKLIVVLDDLSSSERWSVPEDPRVKDVSPVTAELTGTYVDSHSSFGS